jgi:hypothetical protein
MGLSSGHVAALTERSKNQPLSKRQKELYFLQERGEEWSRMEDIKCLTRKAGTFSASAENRR